MTHYFLDNSALIKRYTPELGSAWIRSITDGSFGHTIIIAHITQVEVVSGIMRRKRDGLLSARNARATRLQVDRHSSRQYQVVALTEEFALLAEDLLERHARRAYDAVQLSTALQSEALLKTDGLTGLEFISADARLLAAAASERLRTDDPSTHR